MDLDFYTPDIFAEGYIVLAFPLVHSYVHSFVSILSLTFVEFTSKFFVMFLLVSISL